MTLHSPEPSHGALYSHAVFPEFTAAAGIAMGNFQEQNLLFSSLRSLLSCGIWLGSFPTAAPFWNCVIAEDAAVINSKTSFNLLWLYMKAWKCEPSKAQNAESKPKNYSGFISSAGFLKLISKFEGPYVWFLKPKLAMLKLHELHLHPTDFCEWRWEGGGWDTATTSFGKSQHTEKKLNKQSMSKILSKRIKQHGSLMF